MTATFTGTAFAVVDPALLDPERLNEGAEVPPRLAVASAWAATDDLRAAFELADGDDEDADWLAQCAAAVAALATSGAGHGRAVVSVGVRGVELASAPGDRDHGGVALDDLAWSDVTAVFLDEEDAFGVVAEVADHVGARTLAEVWDDEVVQELLAEHPLLWYSPVEFT